MPSKIADVPSNRISNLTFKMPKLSHQATMAFAASHRKCNPRMLRRRLFYGERIEVSSLIFYNMHYSISSLDQQIPTVSILAPLRYPDFSKAFYVKFKQVLFYRIVNNS
ncbi:hypothetical protein AVEN_151270-1 [Araneus ventricosus]|uniref:Uncharacterized protein n=1 Tax=Araneus ventricosus TaxID=182803 RepID=A0A4Y2HK57_ARAVE|nr:hypothetical protein AVEN_151270-1 [Araneus ventricosus]